MGFFRWLFSSRANDQKNRDRIYELNNELKTKNENLIREVEELDERKNLIKENRAIAYENQQLEEDIKKIKQEIRKLINPNYRTASDVVGPEYEE